MKWPEPASVVSFMVVVLFGGVVVLLLVRPVELTGSVEKLVNILLGVLATCFATVVNYWLGSSFGSRIKSETINKMGGVAPAPETDVTPVV